MHYPIAMIVLETVFTASSVRTKDIFPHSVFQLSSVQYPPAAFMKEKYGVMHFTQRLMADLPHSESLTEQITCSGNFLCLARALRNENKSGAHKQTHVHTFMSISTCAPRFPIMCECLDNVPQLQLPSTFPASPSSPLHLLQPHFYWRMTNK